MFSSVSLLAAGCVCCKAPRLDKQVHYLGSSWMKEDPSSTSGEGWNENEFLFGASKFIFQACTDFPSCQRLWVTATFFEFISFSFFLFINPLDLYVNLDRIEFMCFKQDGAISTFSSKLLKFADLFTYLGNNITSTESSVNVRIGYGLLLISCWSYLYDKMGFLLSFECVRTTV